MTDEKSEPNGGVPLILYRLKKMEGKADVFYADTSDRLVEQEKQTALIQQSYETICKQVDKNEKQIKKNDLWTKIIGALTTFFVAMGTAITVYLASVMQRLR